jgi:hypothetical protein
MPTQAQGVCRNAFRSLCQLSHMLFIYLFFLVLSKSETAQEFLTYSPTVNFMTTHLLIFYFLHGHRQTR